jgi:chemotaxis signal transduction protein
MPPGGLAAQPLEFLAFTLSPEQVKPAPEMGAVLDADYLIGLGTLDDRMLILVDLEKAHDQRKHGPDGRNITLIK